MSVRACVSLFLGILAVLGVSVWTTADTLPPVVASHFAASGAADGFMARSTYRVFVIGLVIGAPLLIAFLPFVFVGPRAARLNIPNREYWLAPGRRDQTVSFLRLHGLWFAAMVAAFLAYVHWLVVQANRLASPALAGSALVIALAVFFAALAAWILALFVRFRRPR